MTSDLEFGLVYGAGKVWTDLVNEPVCSHVLCDEPPTVKGWLASKKTPEVKHLCQYCAFHAVRMRKNWEKVGAFDWELHEIPQGPVSEGEDWE